MLLTSPNTWHRSWTQKIFISVCLCVRVLTHTLMDECVDGHTRQREPAAVSAARHLIQQGFCVAMKRGWKNLVPEHHQHFVEGLTAKPPCARGTISNSGAMQIKTLMYDL